MTFEECFEHWEETGDTHFECFIGEDRIEMFITNDVGEFYKYKVNGVDVDIVNGDQYGLIHGALDFDGWTRW